MAGAARHRSGKTLTARLPARQQFVLPAGNLPPSDVKSPADWIKNLPQADNMLARPEGNLRMSTHDILHRLSETLATRRHADPEKSYTASLFAEGPDSILKKIGEECAELIMAAKDGKRLNIVRESTDVIYHILVLLVFFDMSIEDVSQEMRRREGISGIDEKAARSARK